MLNIDVLCITMLISQRQNLIDVRRIPMIGKHLVYSMFYNTFYLLFFERIITIIHKWTSNKIGWVGRLFEEELNI